MKDYYKSQTPGVKDGSPQHDERMDAVKAMLNESGGNYIYVDDDMTADAILDALYKLEPAYEHLDLRPIK